MSALRDSEVARVNIAGTEVEILTCGQGRPLLFLHPHIGFDHEAPFIAQLAKNFRVIAPSHPGFGRSALPSFMTSVDDLAYFYLDLLAALDLREAVVVGVSFGGWIAASIAVKTTDRISRLILADPVGLKLSGPETRDIVDIFTTKQQEVEALAYHRGVSPGKDMKTMSEDELLVLFRNRESTARFAWSPYMRDPKLAHRLHRIAVPTLVLWGESDRIALPDYGRAYAAQIPGAAFETIREAGHFPHVEQPETFAQKITQFVNRTDNRPAVR
jgi:pimeloyl-ACP methyl ester carboxylesterase